jgi:sarcosine oxidase subunit beta
MATADVVVIGGGVNGASTAFHLASLGLKQVVLVERGHLAAGASGKSGSLVRMHYTNPFESRLALESLKVFHDFDARVGGECGFERAGFVQIVPRGYEATLAHNVEMQRELGINTRLMSPASLKDVLPGAFLDDIGGAAYEPDSGFADPVATTYAFAAAATRRGAQVRTRCAALRVVTSGERVCAVETEAGRIDTEAVVLAPGAWAGSLLAPLGLEYGLQPQRVQVAIFRWPTGHTRRHAVVIDAVNHTWFRPEGPAATLAGTELGMGHTSPDRFEEGVDADYVALTRERLVARLPAFSEAPMRGGWAGVIMMSPDGRPIIDQVPSVRGLWVMLGDSGTSFKTAPAIGQSLAEWIVHGKPRLVDLTPFRSTRFAEGRPWLDEHHYGRDGYGPDRLTISR